MRLSFSFVEKVVQKFCGFFLGGRSGLFDLFCRAAATSFPTIRARASTGFSGFSWASSSPLRRWRRFGVRFASSGGGRARLAYFITIPLTDGGRSSAWRATILRARSAFSVPTPAASLPRLWLLLFLLGTSRLTFDAAIPSHFPSRLDRGRRRSFFLVAWGGIFRYLEALQLVLLGKVNS